jgi:hypothetical protein
MTPDDATTIKRAAHDPLRLVVAGLALVAVLAATAYAIWGMREPDHLPSAVTTAQLERDLEAARAACVRGPPQGPACVEAARLTSALAESRKRP